jgi:hypothetical protein
MSTFYLSQPTSSIRWYDEDGKSLGLYSRQELGVYLDKRGVTEGKQIDGASCKAIVSMR